MFDTSKNINKFLIFFFTLFPILLITGPLFPDLMVVIFSLFFLINFKNFEFEKNTIIFISLFLLFYILINISSLLGDYTLISLKSSLFYFRFIFFAFVVSILVKELNNFQNIKNFLSYSFLLILVFLFIDSFYQFFNGKNLFGFEISSHLSNQRVSSLFGNELILGSYLSKLMFIYLGFFHDQNINDKNLFNLDYKILFILIISLSTIFISGERAAFILAAMGTLIYLIINLNFRVILITISIFSILFVILGNNLNFEKRYLELFKSILIEKKIGSPTHQQHFKTSYKMFKENKIFGHGIKSFRYKCNLDKYNSGPKSCSTHPHNYYLQILSASGVFSFLILLSFFLFISFELLKSFKNKLRENKINNKKNCYLISVFMSIFPFATTGSFFNNWISFTIFLSLGFLISEYKFVKYTK